jgi:hypothetical protein
MTGDIVREELETWHPFIAIDRGQGGLGTRSGADKLAFCSPRSGQ